ncbi:MAG: ABC transporter permease [Terracidiphilus sp.]|jgi:predicted permease
MMQAIINEIRYALRQLRKSPGFTLTAVLTLAFGIGATTAIFSIVEGVLLRPLPFADSARLTAVGDTIVGTDFGGMPAVTSLEIGQYTRGLTAFSNLGAYRQTGFELSGFGEPAQINATRLTAGTFPTLGVSPVIGRPFTQREDDGSQQVAVISYQMWRSRFHGDAKVLGQKLLLDRKPYEIIGVMPRDFEFPLVPGQLNRTELWVPMSLTQGERSAGAGASWNFTMVGRLKPGVTSAQALQDVARIQREIVKGFPAAMASLRLAPAIQPLEETAVAQARPLIRTLFLAVAVVLFIACANLAGLLLVRVIRRRREISVRLALGASSGTIVRQSLVEAMLLSIGGGVVGLVLASAALRVGVSFLPETLPRVNSIALDWQVAAFALGLAVLTGLLCGLLPAFSAAHTGVNEALKEGGRTGTAGSGHARLRATLVIAELAVALVLLTASGLLLRSFEKLRQVNVGFRTDHMLTANYGLPKQQYSTQAAADAFNAQLLSKLQQLPGVQAAGITSILPLAGYNSNEAFYPEGYAPAKGAGLLSSWPSQILGNYFGAAGIPVLRGRTFTEADTIGSPMVIIVNRTLAERFWPGQDPIGKRIHIGLQETPLPWMTVVGEIGDIKQNTADADTTYQIYQPISQYKTSLGPFASSDMIAGDYGTIVLRSSTPPEQMEDSLRAVVRSIDPQLALTQVESMDQVIAEGQASRRFNTVLISSFAGAAVLLALMGIYSVIAFSAAMRTQEMAIRLALGSQRAGILRLVLVSGAKLGLVGCGIGAVAAVFATRLLRSLLFEVDPLDPMVIGLAAISIFLLALVASAIPARRAASIEPMQALRAE